MVTCSELPLTHSVPQWIIYFHYFQEKMFCCSQSHGCMETWRQCRVWVMVVPFAVYVCHIFGYLLCTDVSVLQQEYHTNPSVSGPQTCPGHVNDRDSHSSSQHLTRHHTILPSSSSSSRDLWCGCLKNKQHWQGWLNWDTPELLNQSQYLPCHPSPPSSQQSACMQPSPHTTEHQ